MRRRRPLALHEALIAFSLVLMVEILLFGPTEPVLVVAAFFLALGVARLLLDGSDSPP